MTCDSDSDEMAAGRRSERALVAQIKCLQAANASHLARAAEMERERDALGLIADRARHDLAIADCRAECAETALADAQEKIARLTGEATPQAFIAAKRERDDGWPDN